MQIKIIVFLTTLISGNIGFAQTKLIDSLEKEIEKEKIDSNLIKLYTTIGTEYLYDNIDKLPACSKKIYQLSKKNKNEFGIAVSNNLIANYYYFKGDYKKALLNFKKNINQFTKLKNNFGLGNTYLSLGNVYESMGSHDKAIKYYFKSLKIDEKLGDKQRLSDDYTNIGVFYNHRNNYKLALFYFKKALKFDEEINNEQFIASSLLNIGNAYYNLKDLPKSLDYHNRAYKISSETNNFNAKARIANNLGEIYTELEKYDSALIYFLESVEIKEKFGQKEGLTKTYLNIGVLYQKLNQNTKSFYYLDKSYQLAKEIDFTEGIMDVSLALSFFHEITNHPLEALNFLKEYTRLKDTIFNLKSDEKITEISTKYETEKKDAKLKILNKEKKLSDLENENSKIELKNHEIQRNYFIAGLVLLLALAYFIFNRFKASQKQKSIIETQKLLVEHQKELVDEKQKEIIDSINYAKRLQHAILATKEEINRYIPHNFLYYRPKDIVAGDFYFFEVTNEFIFYAAADSTGHGVPGAMVSIVCSNALTRSVNEFNLTDPGKILDKTRDLIMETFQKSGEDVKDGMDISLISIDRITNEVKWAGANNPLWYIVENEMKEITADKQPIGKSDNPKSFTTHSLPISVSILFLFTDGYADQFGGPKGKKFKYANLQKLLLKNMHLAASELNQKLDDEFSQWKGDLEQVDDVCIIGIKI